MHVALVLIRLADAAIMRLTEENFAALAVESVLPALFMLALLLSGVLWDVLHILL